MKAVFADTFFFVALLNEKDAAHEQAQAFSEDDTRPFVTTAWILTEVADGCTTVQEREAFLQLLSLLRESPDVTIVPPNDPLFEQGIGLFAQRLDKEWSLTDCISFAVMSEMKLSEALTGDHHFEQAGFRALLK
ncbi:MAG: PIN domain-containing protein [Verrucomicrobiota bacterium]